MSKIRQYFSTNHITRGLGMALLSSAFIYLNYWDFYTPLLNTILALISLYFLLLFDKKVWFWYGVGIGLFWFWWISLSLQHYGYTWGFGVGLFFVALIYGLLFLILSYFIDKLSILFMSPRVPHATLLLKAIALLSLSYIHPFGFDWYKPELMFVESYIGIEKWQFAIVLTAMILSIWRKNLLFLLFIIFAYQPTESINYKTPNNMLLVSTDISVEDKWNESKHMEMFEMLFTVIDDAIVSHKKIIVLPESVFPIFLNRNDTILQMLKERSLDITIITGGLYWDKHTPHNSTYIFNKGKMSIANKVLLVPFGESNPLPKFLSDWINQVFYDGSIDYVGGAKITDYKIEDTTYRNAICFEATSEALYTKGKNGEYPKHMIILSNNGWFVPSIEPTLQKLLLLYYHKKYGTTFYHAINMSQSYSITN